jgi:hypothetical protein
MLDIRQMQTNAMRLNWLLLRSLAHRQWSFLVCILLSVILTSSCSKDIDIDIPEGAKQVVVEGTIENDRPPFVILTKSQKFFDAINPNDLSNYFVHGASMKVTGSDGTETELVEMCLQSLNLPAEQAKLVLDALGFTSLDSTQVPDVCIYTVPDVVNYFITGNCSFMGKERTTYNLQINAPGFSNPTDSIRLSATTYIPTAIGIDSLGLKEHTNPDYRDSMMAVYAYVTVPDTFGNFVRFMTKRNDEPFYKPFGGTVYDDRLFVGLSLGLPIERGQAPNAEFDINTDSYFWKGDTVIIKWSNIDTRTYDFFYTLENDGGDSPFSSPVKIKSNISNGLGIWAGYATKYYGIKVPQ